MFYNLQQSLSYFEQKPISLLLLSSIQQLIFLQYSSRTLFNKEEEKV